MRRVEVAPQRLAVWLERYLDRHPGTDPSWARGGLRLRSPGGSAELRALVTMSEPQGPDDLLAGFVRHVGAPRTVALLLIRRGGYAVGVAREGQVVAGKTGTRYVQSRTAAGGWSQQRYARRRAGQTRDLVGAAADAWAALSVPAEVGALDAVVTGGDKALARQLLEAVRGPGTRALVGPDAVAARHLVVPDPRRAVLAEAAERVRAVQVTLTD